MTDYFRSTGSQQDTTLKQTGRAEYSWGVYGRGKNRPICLCKTEWEADMIASSLNSNLDDIEKALSKYHNQE